MNKRAPQSIIPSQGGVLQEFTLRLKLILRLVGDKRVSPWAKLVPLAGLVYWVSPVDFLMGIPGLSAVDDMAVLWFAQYMFIELCPPEVVREISSRLMINHSIVDEVKAQQDVVEEDVVDGEARDVTSE